MAGATPEVGAAAFSLMDLDMAWLLPIAGGIGIFWKQAQSLFQSIKSIFIVTSEMPHDGDIFLFYCWDHFRTSKLGVRRFGFENFYLRPNRRRGHVGMEYQGKSLTFWHGWWPMMLNMESQGTNKSDILSVTFIRGTFDITEIIKRAAVYRNQIQWGSNNSTTHRFKIIRKFGFGSSTKDSDSPEYKEEDTTHRAGIDSSGRPIGLTQDDLGVPIEKEPFKTLFYSSEVHGFFENIKRWKDSRDWYFDHTIQWRMGGLLKGLPGTGKTSFVRAVAQTLDFPIMIMDLPSMSNRDLTGAWHEALNMAPCIVLFEDVDRLFDDNKEFHVSDQAFSMRDPVSLDALLNCISGVEPSEGIITIATANKPEKLDPALLRPGRLDFKVEFAVPTVEDRRHIAARILDHDTELVEQVVSSSNGDTGATVVQMATEKAVIKYWNKK